MIARMYNVANGDTFFQASQSRTILQRQSESIEKDTLNEETIVKALSRLESRIITQLETKIETIIESLITRLETKIDTKFEELHYTIKKNEGVFGRESSHRFTVQLLQSNGKTFGHGVLMRDRKNDYAVVLTASHIAVTARELQEKEVFAFTKIKFVANTEEYGVAKSFPLEVFLDDSYIRNGLRDCGGFRFKFSGTRRPSTVENLKLSQAHAFDTEFHGRNANVKFHSNAVAVLEGDRVRLAAHSKPGCSGTPMFSSTGELLSVLHGDTKHRARKHSGTPSDGEWFSHVYVDRVKNFDGMRLWGHDYECLYAMEEFEAEEWANPSNKLFKPNEQVPEEEVVASEECMPFFGENDKMNKETIVKALSRLESRIITRLEDVVEKQEVTESEKPVVASEQAMKFFEEAKKICGEASSAVFDKEYFKIEEVCNVLLQHCQHARQPISLEDVLVSEGQNVYKAYAAFSESQN